MTKRKGTSYIIHPSIYLNIDLVLENSLTDEFFLLHEVRSKSTDKKGGRDDKDRQTGVRWFYLMIRCKTEERLAVAPKGLNPFTIPIFIESRGLEPKASPITSSLVRGTALQLASIKRTRSRGLEEEQPVDQGSISLLLAHPASPPAPRSEIKPSARLAGARGRGAYTTVPRR